IEAADAGIDASIETYRDAMVTLLAETALNYVEYRTLQERIDVARENADAQEKTMELTKVRFETDLVPKIDVTQSTTAFNLTSSVIPLLESQLAFTKNRLATLTGGFPASVEKLLARPRKIPVPRSGYSAGLSTDLLRSRPDIRRAERELAAQTALIGVAAADLYPRFTLFGAFNLQSVNSSDFFDSASRAYSFGPAMQWQIFSAGRIRSNINIEESRTEQALLNYENSVLQGVEDVESSMVAVAKERERRSFLTTAVSNAEETVDLVNVLYTEGLVDFQRVLDANRTKFESEDQATLSQGDIAKNYIRLYKALGGGTEVEVIPVAEPRTTAESPFKRKSDRQEGTAQESHPEDADAVSTPE
ncbi:MAG: TolC family protein, partial [Verrucomicrobiales bacterium]